MNNNQTHNFVYDKKGNIVLSYIIFRIGRALVFQVTSQDSRFLGDQYYYPRKFVAKNGVMIISRTAPHLSKIDPNRIYIRGARAASDDSTSISQFNSEKEAGEWLKKYVEALQDFGNASEFTNETFADKQLRVSTHIREDHMKPIHLRSTTRLSDFASTH